MGAASFKSFPEMFLHRVASTPDTDAFYHPVVQGDGETWKTMLWKEVGDRVRDVAGGLLSLGLEREQRCSLLCSTRMEWMLADLGILCGAGATTTIYPSNTEEECSYILNDSNTRFIFVEDDAQLAKVASIRAEIPGVEKVINIAGKGGHDGWAITLAELEEAGKRWNAEHPGETEKVARSVTSDQLATLIYTSGTTGRSKGVELLHDSWVFEGEAMDALGFISPADKQYLFLPLAHSFAKVLEAATIRIGIPTAIDGRIDRIVPNLAIIRPTFMAAVPRVFEKVYNKIVTNAKEGGALKYRIFKWAFSVGTECSKLRQQGQQPSGLLGLKFAIADKLVFSKIKALFGGRVRFFISGSAALSREIAEFFHAADILILEGYGLTETSAASFVNRPEKYKFGTVGVPLPGVQVRIDTDGEILLAGRGIMRGYHGMAEITAELLTEDGWLRTGDIGVIDADGLLKITDRKKDLIKTSGGKYVAPQELENRLKTITPLVSQVLVHGNGRNFCSALITLNEEEARKWAQANGKGKGKGGLTYKQLSQAPELKAIVQGAVDSLNSGLARYETIKKFSLLPADFDIATGELTPTLKVKRKVVENRYQELLDAFYTGAVEDV